MGLTRAGDINFRGITRETKAKYILLTPKTNGKAALEIMQQQWHLQKPTMLISVTGASRPFYLDENIERSLKASLLKASQLQGACIVTAGAYSGVTKLVSDALKGCSSAVLLGVTSNNVMNKEVLMSESRVRTPYVVGSYLSQRSMYLDYQHTHFLVVDETNTTGSPHLQLRTSLEKQMKEEFSTPSVLVLINGRFDALNLLHKHVQEVQSPVVIVQNSGRAADVLCYAVRHHAQITQARSNGHIHEDFFALMKDLLQPKVNDAGYAKYKGSEWCEEYYDKIVDCMDKHHLFTIAGGEVDIDTALLNALLSAEQERSTFDKLKLTLVWQRADFARTNILAKKPSVSEKEFEYLMIRALGRGDVDYVRLLMDYGCNVHTLLTPDNLRFLYGYRACRNDFLLTKYVDEALAALPLVDQRIAEYNMKADEENKSLPGEIFEWILNERLCGAFQDNKVNIFITQWSVDKLKFQDPFWELFIWSVLCNLPHMSTFLWPFGSHQMGKSLIGCEVLHTLARHDDQQVQTTQTLKELSEHYRQNAVALLDEVSACANEEETRKMTTALLPYTPTMSCLDMAVATHHYEFVAHNSIQTILARAWTGDKNTQTISGTDYIKYFFAILFPFFMMNKRNHDNKCKVVRSRIFCCCCCPSRICDFYLCTPILTFILHGIASILFLALYSYLVMTNALTVNKSPLEILLFVYVVGYVVDQLYKLTRYDTATLRTRVRLYITDEQNQFDVFNLIVFFTAWVMSMYPSTLQYAHTLHTVNCGFWIIRVGSLLQVIPTLGLYLEMISVMLRQLLWFLCILGVNLLAFGVVSTSLLYPGPQNPITYLRMFMRTWFTLYGDYFVTVEEGEEVEGVGGNSSTTMTHFSTPRYNSYDEYVAWVVMGAYLLITNILLLNIIIAAFNTTYARIQQRAQNTAKYRVYQLVWDFSNRASSPPPLSLLHHACSLLRFLFNCADNGRGSNKFGKIESKGFEGLKDVEYECAMKLSHNHHHHHQHDSGSSSGGGGGGGGGGGACEEERSLQKIQTQMESNMTILFKDVHQKDQEMEETVAKMFSMLHSIDTRLNKLDTTAV